MRSFRRALKGWAEDVVVEIGKNSRKELAVIASLPLPSKGSLGLADLIIWRAKTLSLESAVDALKTLDEIQGLGKVYFNHQEVISLSEDDLQTEPFQRIKMGWHFQENLLQHPALQTFLWQEKMAKDGYGTSVHSLKAVSSLVSLVSQCGVAPDYILLSNVFETSCKPGKPPVESETLIDIIKELEIQFGRHQTRFFLLGGITEGNVHQLKGYKHHGVAVMSLAQFPERLEKLKAQL